MLDLFVSRPCLYVDCLICVFVRIETTFGSLYSGVVDSRFENFHLVVNDNFLQDGGEECQDPSGPIRGTAVF